MHWFANPLSLTLLAFLPVMEVIALLTARRRRRILARFGAPPVIKGLTAKGSGLGLLRGICLACGLILLVVAIAGPQWGRDWAQSAAPGRDLVVVLDLSRSMLAEDVLPNRAERAKQALKDLSDTVQQRGGHRLALVAFAAGNRLVCPLTHDYDHFRTSLAELDAAHLPADLQPKGPEAPSGTRIGAALRTAVEAHDPRYRGYQDILLISDGDDPARDEEWRQGVEAARSREIPVHTVGVGNPDAGSPIPTPGVGPLRHQSQVVLTRLEEQPLRAIADWTGGIYVGARTDTFHLGELFRTQIEPRATHENPDDALPLYRQRYAWFFGGALLLLSLEMVLGRTRAREKAKGKRQKEAGIVQPTHAIFLFPFTLLVVPWLLGAVPLSKVEEFIRRGNTAFAGADFTAAVDLYNRAEESAPDPGLVAFNKAAALYHLGRYREAELHYRYCRADATGLRLARLLYGLGNCIVQQAQDRDARRLQEAMRCYEQCLKQESADAALLADARHNLELARLLWLQAKARKDRGEPENPEQDNNGSSRNPNDAEQAEQLLRRGMLDPRGKAEPLTGTPSDPATATGGKGETPPPGKGNLPTLPDTEDLQPLSVEDATEHLQRATARLARERQEYLRQTAPVVSPSVKNW